MNGCCIIRAAQATDHQNVARLCWQLGYAVSIEEAAERLVQLQSLGEHCVFLAEVKPGEPVGMIHAMIIETLIHPRIAQVFSLVVDESARGQGVGRALVQRAEDWARNRGCRRIRTAPNTSRQQYHQFYRRNGFEHVKDSVVLGKAL
jgi:GNAT superfamily N-acetyltransferase